MASHRHSRKRKYDKSIDALTMSGALEGLFYELKPIIYTLFSFMILRSAYSADFFIKTASFGVLIFGLFIIYARLHYRGIIK